MRDRLPRIYKTTCAERTESPLEVGVFYPCQYRPALICFGNPIQANSMKVFPNISIDWRLGTINVSDNHGFPSNETPSAAPSSHRLGFRAMPGFVASGLLPSVVLLLIYSAVSFPELWTLSFGKIWPYVSLVLNVEFDSTKYKFPVFVLSTVCFPVLTPLLLLPWSYFFLSLTGGAASTTPVPRRFGRAMGAILLLSFANFIVGGIALFATIAFYVWNGGALLPVVG